MGGGDERGKKELSNGLLCFKLHVGEYNLLVPLRQCRLYYSLPGHHFNSCWRAGDGRLYIVATIATFQGACLLSKGPTFLG